MRISTLLALLPLTLASCVGTLTPEHLKTKAVFQHYTVTESGFASIHHVDHSPVTPLYFSVVKDPAHPQPHTGLRMVDDDRWPIFMMQPGQHKLKVLFRRRVKPPELPPLPKDATDEQRSTRLAKLILLLDEAMKGAALEIQGDFTAGGIYTIDWKFDRDSVTAWVADPATKKALSAPVTGKLVTVVSFVPNPTVNTIYVPNTSYSGRASHGGGGSRGGGGGGGRGR